jgi:hypothetical protein
MQVPSLRCSGCSKPPAASRHMARLPQQCHVAILPAVVGLGLLPQVRTDLTCEAGVRVVRVSELQM